MRRLFGLIFLILQVWLRINCDEFPKNYLLNRESRHIADDAKRVDTGSHKNEERIEEDYKYEDINNRHRSTYESEVDLDDKYERENYEHQTREDEKETRHQSKGSYFDEHTIRILHRVFGYTGPTANDAPNNLIRPCDLDDWKCIKKYFASNGKCAAVKGKIPDAFMLQTNTINLPAVSMSITFFDYMVKGFNSATVKEFYVNKKSGNVVFAIDVQNFNLSSPHAYFQYRRVAKEPIVTTGTSTVNFGSILLTTVIPKNPDLRLDLANAHIHTEDSRPLFRFSTEAYKSTDPEVQKSYALLEGPLLPVAVKESFMFQPQIFTTLFIQNAICDFGIKMSD